jgi:hypothetical protein
MKVGSKQKHLAVKTLLLVANGKVDATETIDLFDSSS